MLNGIVDENVLNRILHCDCRNRKRSIRRFPKVPTISTQESFGETQGDTFSNDLDSSTSSPYDDNLLEGNYSFL